MRPTHTGFYRIVQQGDRMVHIEKKKSQRRVDTEHRNKMEGRPTLVRAQAGAIHNPDT